MQIEYHTEVLEDSLESAKPTCKHKGETSPHNHTNTNKIAPKHAKQAKYNSRGNMAAYILNSSIAISSRRCISTISLQYRRSISTISSYHQQSKTSNNDVPEKFHTRRSLSSSTSAIEKRNDALTSSDGVVGFPIDFDTASSIEGKESQVSSAA